MLAYIPYMDPMGYSLVQQEMGKISRTLFLEVSWNGGWPQYLNGL